MSILCDSVFLLLQFTESFVMDFEPEIQQSLLFSVYDIDSRYFLKSLSGPDLGLGKLGSCPRGLHICLLVGWGGGWGYSRVGWASTVPLLIQP